MARARQFVDFLVEQGLLELDEQQALIADAQQRQDLLGHVMLKERILSLRQMCKLLRIQANEPGLQIGPLAVREGMISQGTLEAVVRFQARTTQHPVDTLVVSERLSQAELMAALVDYVKRVDAEIEHIRRAG